MPSKILIAGATGTNGRELVKQLAAHSICIRVLVRNLEGSRTLAAPKVEIVVGELDDPHSLDRAMDGIDKAYVVTAVAPDAVELFENFFEAAKRAGVDHVIKFSALGADIRSPSVVLRQHGQADDILMGSGLGYTILRPNFFHQNMLWQAAAIRSNGQFYLPIGDARQSIIDVRDIAEITVKTLIGQDHKSKIYALTGPQVLSFYDVAHDLSSIIGRPVHYVPVTMNVAEQSLRESGMPEWTARAIAEIQALFATGAFAPIDGTAERLLGRMPRTFRQFATEFASVFSVTAHRCTSQPRPQDIAG